MEYKKKRLNFSEIESETFRSSEPTIYEIMWNGVKFEFFINYRSISNKAVIFGSGGMTAERRPKFPIFDRISWADVLLCTGIWYFDPTLYLHDDLLIGWGYGTNDRWYLKDIATLLEIILRKLNIPSKNTLFYGSSAGGFTSIMLATMFRSKASVVNAQFNFEKYSIQRYVRLLEKIVLKEGESLIDEHIDVTSFMAKEKYVPLIHIIENIRSESDVVGQLSALTQGLFDKNLNCADRIKIEFFCNDAGHSGMPTYEESLNVIHKDLNKKEPGEDVIDNTIKQGQKLAQRVLRNVRNFR